MSATREIDGEPFSCIRILTENKVMRIQEYSSDFLMIRLSECDSHSKITLKKTFECKNKKKKTFYIYKTNIP